MTNEIDDTFQEIGKRYGKQILRKGSQIPQPGRISTGIFTLDFALLGGFPDNRLSMIVGERHGGKSMMSNLVIANAQSTYPDQTVALLDIEGTFEGAWAQKLGVNLDELTIAACESGEMAADIGDALIHTQEVSLIVVDSIAALTPMKEIEASAEDSFVGLQSRLVGIFIRKMVNGLIRERNRGHYVTMLFLNQFRSKIGGFSPYGDPRSIPGGKALEFTTSVQLIIKNKENKGKDEYGNETMTHNDHTFQITKNKLNGGPRTGEFVVLREDNPESGLLAGSIDDSATVLSFAKKLGAYGGGGSSWKLSFDDYNLKFGKAKEAVATLQEDPELYWDLRTHLIRQQAIRLKMPAEFIESIV